MSDDTRSFNGQERTWAPYSGSASDKYWEREKTVVGRVVNDVIDTARKLASNVRMNLSEPSYAERHVHRIIIDENRLEKADWRARFAETGVMTTASEIAMTAEAKAIFSDTRKADIERAIPTPKEWEPSAELNAVMALSGDRTNAGVLPEAANDGIHLLKPITAEAIKDALFGPEPTGPMAEAIERLRSARDADAKLDGSADRWQQNVQARADAGTHGYEPVISVVSSNFGVVARQNFPDGVAYARLADGAWTQSAGHPSPFVPVSKYDVPERFKSAVEDYMRGDMQPKEERQQKSQQYWERLAQTGANETAKDVQAQQVKDAEKKQTTMRL